VQKVWWYA